MTDTGVTVAAETDQFADDPFFKRKFGTQWNACIGKQGYEENYLDGYIEAAKELVSAVIDKNMIEKRDTLVLPILYNARHAVELVLKFVVDRLAEAKIVNAAQRPNHNIHAYWNVLYDASLGDEKLKQTVQALKPFVDSLTRIDSDGQELRYHQNKSKKQSLSDYSLANLQVIRESLSELGEIISVLKNRTLQFIDERATGACTARCSRRDLLTIAQLLPRREFWTDNVFVEQKNIITKRFGLGSNQFSKALDMIQANREMKAIIGVESDPLYVSDENVIWVVEQWRRIHPKKDADTEDLGIDYFDLSRFDAMKEHLETENEVISEINERIKADELADIEAMFYLARDHIFSEHYERRIETARKEHAAQKDAPAEIAHLISKTNFLACLQQSALKLGRLQLAKKLTNL